ncbi:MAG: AAC(3) family N-acetyltransferase [Anaerolineae bacterium]|nr:AAC(3) family N-acetyltransferase [Anaerolineae bacterium]
MRPEKGDPSVRVTWQDVCRALQQVGVEAGDTAMFHSSLSSMGTVVGGPDAVIRGFLEAVGPEGTVAVPTLCNWEPGEERLVFQRWDPKSSPAYVGAIPDRFWRRPDARRSDHATHSVAAIGAKAEELTANHGTSGLRPGPFGDRAFARESPWQKLADWNAAYCFIGVTMRVATAVHLVETLVVERALARCPEDSRACLSAEVVGWMKPGVWPWVRVEDREVLEEQLAERGLARYGRIGSATLRCTHVGDLVHAWVGILESDPARWLPEEFCRWLAETMIRDP